jgi:thioredoxin 1
VARPLDVGTGNFESEVLRAREPVLADFWAEWCGPCRLMHPIVEALAEEFDGRVRVVRINVDENPELAARYDVYAIPTFIIFRDGMEVDRLVGAISKSALKERVEKVITKG